MTQKELPLLAGIAALLRWLEELVFLLSGPGLTLAAGIAVTDLLTHGAILAGNSWMLLTWGVLTAVGCESQLVGTFDKLRQSVIHRRRWAMLGWLILGLTLAYVTFVSVEVFAYQQSQGLNEAQALAQLGISATAWLWQRSLLSVGLVALAGFNRYRPEIRSLQDERAELHRELELTPLKQRLTEMKAVGAVNLTRTVAATAAGKARPKHNPSPRFPTGGGSPAAATNVDGQPASDAVPELLRLQPSTRKVPALGARDRVFRLLGKNPNLSKREIARLAKVSETTASKWRTAWRKEVGQASERVVT